MVKHSDSTHRTITIAEWLNHRIVTLYKRYAAVTTQSFQDRYPSMSDDLNYVIHTQSRVNLIRDGIVGVPE